MEHSQYIVISLGGSLIIPDEIDVEFLKEFTGTLKEYADKGFRFVIITGGGRTARTYALSAKEINNPSNIDLDWIGIAVTRLNAEFIRVLFDDYAGPEILFNPEIAPTTDKPIIVGGGWKPGNSSDLAAVIAAKTIGAQSVINLSNVHYVYDKDPRYNPDAVKIEKASWKEFRALLPKDWDPGLNSPFDPIAAEQAESLGLKVMIMNGKNVENLKDCLDGKSFIGSIIQ
jgi:uridylate kinase